MLSKNEKAIELYTRSTNQGNAIGQYNLGCMYHDGEGVEQNYEKAIELYTLSVNQGNSCAQNNLAYMYRNGEGVEQNYEKAIELYTLSVCQGDTIAQDNLKRIDIEIMSNIIQNLFKKIKNLEEANTELEYRPGGIGFHQAKNHFDELRNQYNYNILNN